MLGIGFYNFLQRLKLRWLFLGIATMTVGFAFLYFCLGLIDGHGLRPSPSDAALEWYDYIYFSVITETTLGYGDIAPIGWSRLVAVLQVFFGVIAAGILVAKVTSGAINRLLEIESAVGGIWIDIIKISDDKIWLGIVTFESDNGTILFRGVNYRPEGTMEHTFSCQLLYHNWPHYLIFSYDEAHEPTIFHHGQTTVTFNRWRYGRPQCLQVSVKDQFNGVQVSAVGWRVTKKQWLKKIKREEHDADFIRELYDHYKTQWIPK